MSKTIKHVECAHCGETVGTYYVTCPYCGHRLAAHSLPPREKHADQPKPPPKNPRIIGPIEDR